MKYLYHLTYSKNLESIMQNGLIPLIGENSASIGERKATIHLSDKKSIPFWMIILDTDTVLKVDVHDKFKLLQSRQYHDFSEYIIYNKINPDKIFMDKKPSNSTLLEANQILAQIYTYEAENLCVRILCAENINEKDYIYVNIMSMYPVFQRIDFSHINKTNTFKQIYDKLYMHIDNEKEHGCLWESSLRYTSKEYYLVLEVFLDWIKQTYIQ